MGFLVHLDDLDLDGLSDRQDFGRMVDPAPCHVGHVEQTVHTAEIDERAVFGDVFNHAIHGVAFTETDR